MNRSSLIDIFVLLALATLFWLAWNVIAPRFGAPSLSWLEGVCCWMVVRFVGLAWALGETVR